MSILINMYEAKTRLSELIREVENTGEPVTICRNGKPTVDLVLHPSPKNPLEQDPQLKGAHFTGDPCQTVPEEDWPEEFR